MILRITLLSLCLVLRVQAQENAGSSVSKSLFECYNKTENLDRERRMPSTMNCLIDIIRKVESGPSVQNDREFSKELIHRFTQDGIIQMSNAGTSQYSVPFTPKGMQSDKHRILLRKLVPGSAVNFPNETLSELERCSLHFMLSNSVDIRERGDEATVCNKLDRFQRRIRRDVDPNDEVETFYPSKSSSLKGNLENGELDEEPEPSDDQVDTNVFQSPNSRSVITYKISDCPVENGAVYTRWGTVQAGTVIAGIAAGREKQTINTKEGYVADNRYAATLAGDLAEVGLHQGASGKETVTLGAQGGWNGTQVPRWYFIQKNSDIQMTDAEIRGGLDALIIAKNIEQWGSRASSLKISQVLDMYYSPRGVFSKKYRACNRKQLFTEVAPSNELIEQTIAFSFLLDDEAKLQGSILPEGIKAYGEKAVEALKNYIPTLQDLSCGIEDDTIERASTDILIIMDTQWDYKVIHRALAYLLDNLDVNKYGSNYTIVNAKSGEVMVNSSASVLDFYAQYNRTTHLYSTDPAGFDASRAYSAIEEIVRRKMDDDKANKIAGGRSTIALFVLYGTLDTAVKTTANDRKQYYRTYLPDLTLLVLGRNSREGYSDLVMNSGFDAFDISDTSVNGASITDSINPLISRIKQIPRKVVNPNCGSGWSGSSSSESFDQYVEPNGVNYYRISPNYFFGEGARSVKIQGYGYGNLEVCTSRQNARPSKNFTEGDVRCESLSESRTVEFSLADYCSSYDQVSSCPSVYISVQATATGEESTNIRCSDSGCRFPDNVKYAVQVQGLGCSSASFQLIGNAFLLTVLMLARRFLS